MATKRRQSSLLSFMNKSTSKKTSTLQNARSFSSLRRIKQFWRGKKGRVLLPYLTANSAAAYATRSLSLKKNARPRFKEVNEDVFQELSKPIVPHSTSLNTDKVGDEEFNRLVYVYIMIITRENPKTPVLKRSSFLIVLPRS